MPYGVIIKTPPPQFSTLRHGESIDENVQAKESNQCVKTQSDLGVFHDFSSRLNDLSLLADVTLFRHNGSISPAMLSAQLLRGGCPINQFLALLHGYRESFEQVLLWFHAHTEMLIQRTLKVSTVNQAGLTITTLGKVCYDLSNHLEKETMSRSEIEEILDWIGFSADVAFLSTLFSQNTFTIRAVWESLTSKAHVFRHEPALNVLLSLHLSIHNQTWWTVERQHYAFEHYIDINPCLAASLVDAYPYPKWQLDHMLRWAAVRGSSTKVLKQLCSAGARLDPGPHDDTVFPLRIGQDANSDTTNLDSVEILLEAGAVIDHACPRCNSRNWVHEWFKIGWRGPNQPAYTTDYILLSKVQSSPWISRLWSLVSPYSDRQQTTVTVPGIFEAVRGGQDSLCSYLNARWEPEDDRHRRQTLEVALSEASERGHVDVVQGLMHFGVDPNVRTLPDFDTSSWHPIIRAVNAGQKGTLQVLTATSKIDLALLNEVMGSELDFCALQSMGTSQRDEVLRALSTLEFNTATRREILLNAIESHSRNDPSLLCEKCGHGAPDFELVGQLLQHGLACLDRTDDLDEAPPILLRAIQQDCSVRALYYIVEPDVGIISALSGRAIAALLEATLKHSSSPSMILNFLAQKNETFQSDVQNNANYILRRFLRERDCAYSHRFCYGREPENDCECVKIMKWLLDLGASFESNYGSLLAELMEHASSDSFMLEIIRRGADLNIADRSGRTALQKSIRRGRLQLAVALIERGVDINAPAASYRRTVLQEACYTGAPLWFITFVLDHGADINAPPASEQGYTALQAACSSGAELSCINLLLKKGADVNGPPSIARGMTALQCAAKQGHINVVGLLLDHGADVNALSGYMLRLSVSRCGMPPTPKFEGFIRAIDVAALASRLDMVHFLIAAGARSYRPGRTGFDGAIELAISENHFVVADLLREQSELRFGNFLQAENEWLRENPQAHMYDGRIVPAGLVPFIEREGGDTEAGFKGYMQMELGIPQHPEDSGGMCRRP